MGQFPNQKLTRKEKIKEYGSIEQWAELIFNSITEISTVYNNTDSYNSYDKEVLLDLSNGIITKEDFDYVTKPYGEHSPKYPAEFRHYDRISSKLHLLVGEEIKRPFNFKAISVNPEAVTVTEQVKKDMIIQSLQQELRLKLQEMGALPPEEEGQEPQTIEQIEEYINTTYQDIHEIQANMALEYIKEFNNLLEVFNKGWEYLLATGDDIFYTSTSYNEPLIRCVDPRYFEYDRSPNVEYIEDAQWAYEERWIPSSKVYEEYGEYLSEDDMEAVEKMKGNFSQNIGYGSGVPTIYLKETDDNSSSFGSQNSHYTMNSNSVIRVVHFCWKGLRKIGFVSFRDEETGEIQERVVGEGYKKQPEDLNITWEWVNEVWEGIKLGQDLIVGVQPRPNQYKSMDNPNSCKLPYTGISDPNLSVVKRVKEMQYLYDIIMYRMELAIARAKGKMMVMDTAQIPTTEGMDIPKWIDYADTSGFAFVNSFEEGKGVFQGQRPNFNQFTAIDLTMSNTIQQYVGIADKLDMLIEDVTGVTRQRQGQISQYETTGGVERSVVQSSAITEYLFYKHNRVKKRVITNLLEESKLCWINGKKAQYVMDDMTRKIINIDGDIFNNSEYAIFVSDSSKNSSIKQNLEQLAQVAMQNQQAKFSDVIAILETDSVAKAKSVLQRAEDKAAEQAQQAQQQAEEARQKEVQMGIDAAKEDREDRQAHEIEKETLKGNFKLKEKEIDSFKFQQDQDSNNNGVPDQLEIAKLRQQQLNDSAKNSIELKKIAQKDREITEKAKVEKAKLNKVKPK
jgi:hypothetical protein